MKIPFLPSSGLKSLLWYSSFTTISINSSAASELNWILLFLYEKNELVLNTTAEKTESMLFGTAKNLRQQSQTLNVTYRDQLINNGNCTEWSQF